MDKAFFQNYVDPFLGKTMREIGAKCILQKERLGITLPYWVDASSWLGAFHEYLSVLGRPMLVELSHAVPRYGRIPSAKRHPGIKNVIAVGSGKGGVGKSTVSVALAEALSVMGAKVGILDADIYGPNVPSLLGIEEKPAPGMPVVVRGMPVMSMALLSDQPMMWRGPMVSKAIMDLLNQTEWGMLDYLVVDLPPGTGDAQLTLAKQFPITSALMVTSPHPMSVIDTLKNIVMFKQVKVPMLGLLENMSSHRCEQCDHLTDAGGGGVHLAEVCDMPLLGQWPREDALAMYDRDQMSEALKEQIGALAFAVIGAMVDMPIDYGDRFGKIKVEGLS